MFRGLSRPLLTTDGLLPTELFPLRAEVERSNASRLASLLGTVHAFEARDSGSAPLEKRSKLLDNMVVQRKLELKKDAQVMLIKNVDENLVNGSVGRVLGFFSVGVASASVGGLSSTLVKKEVTPNPSRGPRKTGSQESTLSSASGNGKAITVVRNIEVGEDGRTPTGHPSAKENVRAPLSKGKAKDEELYPLVEFFTPQGKEVVLLLREEFRVEDNEGKLLARRVQVSVLFCMCSSVS